MKLEKSLVLQKYKSEIQNVEISFTGFEHKTVYEVIEEFLGYKSSEQTKRAYRSDIKVFFDKIKVYYLRDLGFVPYHELVRLVLTHINSYKNVEKHRPDQVINPKTINRKAYALSAFFKFLINVYNYPKNPLNNFISLKEAKRSNTTSLTKSEIFELIEFLKKNIAHSQIDFRNYLIIMCLFSLALRRNEVANLRWKDINLDRQSINVFQKGGTYKELPIPDNLLKLLFGFRSEYAKLSGYIFHPLVNNRTGVIDKPITTDLIFKIVKKIIPKVIPDKKITPHSFRKTFVEFALTNNQDFISIINATGHSNIEMVKYYDTRDTLKNNAINQMNNIF